MHITEYIFKACLEKQQIFATRDISSFVTQAENTILKNKNKKENTIKSTSQSSKYKTKEDTAVLKRTHATETKLLNQYKTF